jgi:hypothetical protein
LVDFSGKFFHGFSGKRGAKMRLVAQQE